LISKAQWFWKHNPELEFGWVMVLLCAYLIWEAWESRPEPTWHWCFGSSFLAVSGGGVLVATQLYQAAYGLTPASMSGLALGVMLVIMSNLWFVFGWSGVRHFALAFAFVLFALPVPSVIYSPIVMGLQSKVATINVELLNIIGIPAEQVGSLIRLPNGTVGVDEACSGIRSLQSTVMATVFIGYLTLRTRRLQCALLVLGIGLAILGNVIRSLFLSYMANAQGLSAIDKFHDAAGWSILLFTAGGVAALAALLGKAERMALLAKTRSKVLPTCT
jgi:exosortase